jgi:hypothetical protein
VRVVLEERCGIKESARARCVCAYLYGIKRGKGEGSEEGRQRREK